MMVLTGHNCWIRLCKWTLRSCVRLQGRRMRALEGEEAAREGHRIAVRGVAAAGAGVRVPGRKMFCDVTK